MGHRNPITRCCDCTATTYSHEYATAGEYVIKIGGYRTCGNSISFASNLNLAKIEGSLGAIFHTIKNRTALQVILVLGVSGLTGNSVMVDGLCRNTNGVEIIKNLTFLSSCYIINHIKTASFDDRNLQQRKNLCILMN